MPKKRASGKRRRMAATSSAACRSPEASPATIMICGSAIEPLGLAAGPESRQYRVERVLKTPSSSATIDRNQARALPAQTTAVLRRLAPLARPQPAIVLAAFASMALLGATTAAYAYLTGPALRFLLSGGTAGLGAVERFLPVGLRPSPRDAIWWLPAAIAAIGVLKGAAYLGQFYWMGLF